MRRMKNILTEEKTGVDGPFSTKSYKKNKTISFRDSKRSVFFINMFGKRDKRLSKEKLLVALQIHLPLRSVVVAKVVVRVVMVLIFFFPKSSSVGFENRYMRHKVRIK